MKKYIIAAALIICILALSGCKPSQSTNTSMTLSASAAQNSEPVISPTNTNQIEILDMNMFTVTKNQLAGKVSFFSLQEALNASSLIILGIPNNDIINDKTIFKYFTNQYTQIPLIEAYYTLRSVKIIKVLKGSYANPEIDIAEGAVVINGDQRKEICVDENYSIAKKGYKYIFVLKKQIDGLYYIAANSKFNIDGSDVDEVIEQDNVDPYYASLKKQILEFYKDSLN